VRVSRLIPFLLVLAAGFCAAWPFRQMPSPPEEAPADIVPLALTDPASTPRVQRVASGGVAAALGLDPDGESSPAEPLVPAEIVASSQDGSRPVEPMRLTSGTLAAGDPLERLTPPPPLPTTFGVSPLEGSDWQPAAMPHALQFSPEARARPYRLRDGDTLESLAERFLGDTRRAEEIFQANRQVLVHPDLLPVGKTIMIPPRVRVEELEPAAR